MKNACRLLVLFALFIAPSAASARNYALLVGVSGYTLKDLPKLKGPENDVRLMWDLLRGRGFDADAITVLADKMSPGSGPGSEMPAQKGEPTAANILASLDALANTVKKDDTAVIYFSGHGSKIPQAVPEQASAFVEPDGEEKVLLAIDVKEDEHFSGTLPGGILGSTLRKKLDQISAKAWVWVILDACHAGGMTRGIDTASERFVDPRRLGIPMAPPKASVRPLVAHPEWVPDGSRGRVVAFLAADGDRFAVEQSGEDGAYHGFFTYNLAGVLKSREYGSFRELANALVSRSAVENGSHPSPVFEGDLDQPLFGGVQGERRWIATLDAVQQTATIQAGAMQGLSEGTVVELDDGTDVKAKAKITEAGIAISKAHITGLTNGKPLDPQKPLGAKVVQASIPFTLKVARPKADRASAGDPATLQAFAVVERLTSEKKSALPIVWTAKDSPSADVHLYIANGVIYLLPKSGELIRDGQRTTPAVQIGATPEKTADALISNFWRLIRQKNLLRIASNIRRSELSKAVEVTLTLHRDPGRFTSLLQKEEQDCTDVLSKDALTLEASAAGRNLLTQCDSVTVQVVNRWHKDIDVTLLYLDSEGGVGAQNYEDKALVPAGQAAKPTVFTPPVRVVTWCNPAEAACERYRPEGYAPVGIERLVVIAAERESTPRTFHYLDQPGLDKAREELSTRKGMRGPEDSFDELMRAAALAPDQTRGMLQDKGDVAVKVYQWEVVPPAKLKLGSHASQSRGTSR
jgi:Caspase domain